MVLTRYNCNGYKPDRYKREPDSHSSLGRQEVLIRLSDYELLPVDRRRIVVMGNKVTRVKYYSTKSKHQSGQNEARFSRQSDIFGPPHPISNIPHVQFAIADDETVKEKKFRKLKEDLASWQQQFWLNHNENFQRGKKAYLNKRENPNTRIDEKQHADDLSIFYKDFLDKNWGAHLNYQREWYKKNFNILWYGFQVEVERMSKKVLVKNSNSSNKK